MHLLHVLPHLIVGGAERLVLDLAALQAARQGWRVAIAAAPGVLCRDVPPGVTYFPMPGYPRDPISIARWRRPLSRAIESFRPDVVQTHAIQVTLPFADMFRRFPVVMTSHTRRPIKDLVAVAMTGLGRCDLVSVTEAPGPALRAARHLGLRSRVHTIPNGVDVPFWAAADDGVARGRSVVWAGRLEPNKRPMLAVDVIERVARQVDDVTLTIAGGGQLEGPLAARVAASAVRDRIALVGNVDRERLRVIYTRGRVILNTSEVEGLPMALLEAAAAGCIPVVPALPSLVTDGLHGSGYYAPRDANDAAERVVEVLMSDPPRMVPSDVRACEARYAALYTDRVEAARRRRRTAA